MALVYATPTDLTAWSGVAAPANATQLLRRASGLVRKHTAALFYATDVNGLPTDTVTLQAFKDATTAQAQFWAVNNLDPAGGALTQAGILTSKRIGSAALSYDVAGAGSVAAYQTRIDATSTLCEESVDILLAAGLNLSQPWVVG